MELVKDELKIKIFDTRERMGRVAAADVAFCVKKLLTQKRCINIWGTERSGLTLNTE